MAAKVASHPSPHIKEELLKEEFPSDSGIQSSVSPILSGKNDSDKERRKLKKSCESCSKSKIKCSGEYPICSKCKSSNKKCVYLPRKKRVNAPKKQNRIVVRSTFFKGIVTCLDTDHCIHGRKQCTRECIEYIQKIATPLLIPPLESPKKGPTFGGLYANESLHWNVYESLLTTYANDFKYGHLCMMLRRKFHIFKNDLKNRSDKYSKQSLERLSSILESENIDLDHSYELAQKFIPLKFPNRKQITYESFKKFSMFRNIETETETGAIASQPNAIDESKVGECQGSCEMLQSGRTIIHEMQQKVDTRTPMLRVRSDHYMFEPKKNYAKVQVNDAFRVVFGVGDEEMNNRMRNHVGAFLPFGANILASLASNEDDILQYLQVMCVKNSTKHPETFPHYLELPTAHMLNLNIRSSAYDNSVEPIPCMVQVVYRKYLDEFKEFEEIYLLINALEPLGHLFTSNDTCEEIESIGTDEEDKEVHKRRINNDEELEMYKKSRQQHPFSDITSGKDMETNDIEQFSEFMFPGNRSIEELSEPSEFSSEFSDNGDFHSDAHDFSTDTNALYTERMRYGLDALGLNPEKTDELKQAKSDEEFLKIIFSKELEEVL